MCPNFCLVLYVIQLFSMIHCWFCVFTHLYSTLIFRNKVKALFWLIYFTFRLQDKRVGLSYQEFPNRQLCKITNMLQFIALNRLSFQIFGLLPITKVSSIPHEVVDSVECLHVRPRRYVLPYPRHDERDDAHTVFQVILDATKFLLLHVMNFSVTSVFCWII